MRFWPSSKPGKWSYRGTSFRQLRGDPGRGGGGSPRGAVNVMIDQLHNHGPEDSVELSRTLAWHAAAATMGA